MTGKSNSLVSLNILTLTIFCTFQVSYFSYIFFSCFFTSQKTDFLEVNDMLITLLICENSKQSTCFYIIHKKESTKRAKGRKSEKTAFVEVFLI